MHTKHNTKMRAVLKINNFQYIFGNRCKFWAAIKTIQICLLDLIFL